MLADQPVRRRSTIASSSSGLKNVPGVAPPERRGHGAIPYAIRVDTTRRRTPRARRNPARHQPRAPRHPPEGSALRARPHDIGCRGPWTWRSKPPARPRARRHRSVQQRRRSTGWPTRRSMALFQYLLDGALLALHLPAVKTAAVVLDDQPELHVVTVSDSDDAQAWRSSSEIAGSSVLPNDDFGNLNGVDGAPLAPPRRLRPMPSSPLGTPSHRPSRSADVYLASVSSASTRVGYRPSSGGVVLSTKSPFDSHRTADAAAAPSALHHLDVDRISVSRERRDADAGCADGDIR